MYYKEFLKTEPVTGASDMIKPAYFAGISHEIRTHLNGILAFSQSILKSKEIDSDVRNNVEMIVECGNSLHTFFDSMMYISKIETGQMKINNKPFFLNTLMDEIFTMFLNHPLYKQKNLERQNIVLRHDQSDEKTAIISDPGLLKKIFVNLIDNALKYTEKGYIYYGYSIRNGEVLFYVMDSGTGIPADKKEKIFDRFAQENNSLACKYGGAGLGLTISKGLSALLNGKIWCVSDWGKGSNFFFTVPYRPANKLTFTNTPLKKNLMDKDWSDHTVLIVEDDTIDHKVIKAMLQNTKINIIHAFNEVKAIEEVRMNPKINLALMDVRLPGMNSFEVIGKILDINPALPVIAQTATANSEIRHKCLEAGCVDYIGKPVNMGDLFAKISKFLPENHLI